MKINICQITITARPTSPYPFHEVLKQIAKWLPYVLDSLTNSIFQVLNRRWAVREDLVFHVTSREEVARCQITIFQWIIVILLKINVV